MAKQIDTYTDITGAGNKLLGYDPGGNQTGLHEVQTSATDTTADRLMAVGAFGIGEEPPVISTSLPEHSTLIDTGNDTTLFGTNITGIHVVRNVSPERSFSIGANAFSEAKLRVLARSFTSDGEQGPYELHHSGDYPSDSAWTTTTSLVNSWTGTVKYIKRLGWVTVDLQSMDGSSATSTGILALPSEYRPAIDMYGTAIGIAGTDVVIQLVVQNSGAIILKGDNYTNSDISGSITYPVL